MASLRGSHLAVQLVVLVCLLAHAGAIFYYTNEGAKKCFLEEVPFDTLIVGKFKLDLRGEEDGSGRDTSIALTRWDSMGVRVTVRSPTNELLLDRDFPKQSHFGFTSQVGGEFTICFTTNTSRWFGPGLKLKMNVNIETGAEAVDYEAIAKREHLSKLETHIKKLNDKVRGIMREQNYQKKREEAFRNTSEATNERVLWWSIFQILVVAGTGIYQVYHLKNFFRKKKIV